MPNDISPGTRLRAWERAAEWPLAGAAIVFLAAYAWEVLTNAQGAAKETADAPTSEAETNPAHQPPHQDADPGHDPSQTETLLP